MDLQGQPVNSEKWEFNSFLIPSFSPTKESFSKSGRLIRYHYTSATALNSILFGENAKLWFTDVRYMNDRAEKVFCVKRLMEFLCAEKEYYPFCWKVVDALLLQRHTIEEYTNLVIQKIEYSTGETDTLFSANKTRSFVFCMSEQNDSLAMWNYYVKNGKYEGYSVAFDVYNLLKSFDAEETHRTDPIRILYGSVLYDKEKQTKAIEEFVKKLEKVSEKPNGIALGMAKLQYYIETKGLFFKHQAFSGEKEYRIAIILDVSDIESRKTIFSSESLKNLKLDYCERNGVFSPHLELQIKKNAVKKITISPTIEREIAESSLRERLVQKGYSAEISVSEIPIRF